MKRPLFIFTIYMFVFMSILAITGPAAKEGSINSTAVAQIEIANK